MADFNYVSVKSLEAAVDLLAATENAYLVAGATNTMVDIRAGKISAATLVNIDIKELSYISMENGVISVGASTVIARLADSEILKEHAPALFLAANVFADPVTRNSATIAGNVASASPAADTAPALLVHDASVHMKSKRGERVIAMGDFFKGVGKTDLAKGEIITHFTFAPRRSGFVKLGLRNAMAISVVTAAASVAVDAKGILTDCRIALGSVAPTPVRARNVEAALLGRVFDDDAAKAISKAIGADIKPISDVRASAAYRMQVAPVLVKRAVLLALNNVC